VPPRQPVCVHRKEHEQDECEHQPLVLDEGRGREEEGGEHGEANLLLDQPQRAAHARERKQERE
jgi:hypothetical protein